MTPWELLPTLGPSRATALRAENQRFLRAMERQFGRAVDLVLLRQWLREQNLVGMVRLGEQLTEGQHELLGQANESEEIETLVRLNQRLRALVINAEMLEQNMESTFSERLEQRHTEAQSRLDEERGRSEQELAEIEAELGPIELGIEERERRRVELDLDQQIRRLQRQAGDLWRQIQRLQHGRARDELQRQRRELLQSIQEFRVRELTQQGELRELRAEIQGLRRQIQPRQRRRQRILERQARGELELPYGLLHPGRLGSQDSRRITGRLADLNPQPNWATLAVQIRVELR